MSRSSTIGSSAARWAMRGLIGATMLALGLILFFITIALAGVACDGVDDIGTAANQGTFDFANTTFSVELWAKWAVAANNRVISKNSSSGVGGWVMLTTSSGKIECDINASAAPVTVQRATTSTTLADGNPHHVVCVFLTDTTTAANNTVTIYIDGVLDQGTAIKTGTAYATNSNPVTMCARAGALFLAGTVDNVRITNGALSAADVLSRAKSQLRRPMDTYTTVAQWNMESCSPGASVDGVTFADRSGGGNTVAFDNGANNTGMTCDNSIGLMYPGGFE